MSTTTRKQNTDRAMALTAAQSTSVLIASLLSLEGMIEGAADPTSEGAQAQRLTRAWVISELEARYPRGEAAVQDAFEVWDAAHERGEDPVEVDYVAVLVANIWD